MLSARALLAVTAAGVVLSACGEAGAASANDPVSVVTGYMQAVGGGQQSAAQAFLQKDINDGIPLKEPTTTSRYVSQHKGAKWQIVAVPWADAHGNPLQTKDACTVTPPQGGQLCIVTVEVDTGSSKVWFHFDVENRYPPGKWEILNVTRVDTKPEDLLPNGNEAHAG
jgi:hypothetical protein